MRTDIEARVRELIGRVAKQDVSRLRSDDDLVERLGVDSLQGLQILAGVEKQFDVRLPDDELIKMRTIGRIADAVQRLRSASERVSQSSHHEAHEDGSSSWHVLRQERF
jgi:acyl carrier protein